MSPSPYTEDTLVQTTTAEYLEHQLGWQSVYAYNSETFGPDGTLGRTNDGEVVLTRYLRRALEDHNPGLPSEAYENAIRLIVQVTTAQSTLQTNQEKYRLLRNGVQRSHSEVRVVVWTPAGCVCSISKIRTTTTSSPCASFGSRGPCTEGAPMSWVSSTAYRSCSWNSRTSIATPAEPTTRTWPTTRTPFPTSSITTPSSSLATASMLA